MFFQSVALPAQATISSNYYHNFNHLAPFFPGGDSHQGESFLKRKDYLLSNCDPVKKAKVAKTLVDYNRSLGAGKASLDNAGRLAEESTLAIVTGQQAGLLTGPMLTLYKAITGILLARKYEEKLATPVVPVFWIASEDHDFQEINHVHILGEKKRHKTIYLPYRPLGQQPVQEIPTGEACAHFLTEALRQFQLGPYIKETESLLKKTLARTENLADWFGTLLLELFQDEGLVCLNPMLPELRNLQGNILLQSLQSGRNINDLLEENEKELKAMGLSATVQKKKNHTHLFFLDKGQRLPIFFDEKGFTVGENHWTFKEMEGLAEKTPAKFSPDVILRPIIQEELLPVLAYVAGPGEIDYWVQLPSIFKFFGFSMPIIYPRNRLTLIEPELTQLLSRHGLAGENIFIDLAGELEERLQKRDEIGLDNLFRQGRKKIEDLFQETFNDLEKNGGTSVSQNWGKGQGRILREWSQLEKRAWRVHKNQHRDLLDDFQRISRELLPTGQSQENIYNLFSYYPTYGPELIKSLMERDLILDRNHKFAFIGGK